MVFWSLLLATAPFFLPGCAPKETPEPKIVAVAPTDDPATHLTDQFHSAAFQTEQAVESLDRASTAIHPLIALEQGETKEALLDIQDGLDAAGHISGKEANPPTLAEVRADIPRFQEKRLGRVRELETVIDQLRDAEDTLTDMLNSTPPSKIETILSETTDAVDDAIGYLEEADRQLGGNPASESENKAPEKGKK
jgi:hypothetical protein